MRLAALVAPLWAASWLAGCATPQPALPALPDRTSLHHRSARLASELPRTLVLAERPSTATLTLDAAVELALLNSPNLQARYARAESLLLEEPRASSLDDPMAMVGREEPFRGPGDAREDMLRVSQTFPWFGKRELRGSIARSMALEEVEEYRAAALDLRRDVVVAWHGLDFALRDRALLLEEKRLLAEAEEATLALYASGTRDRGALLRVRTESAMVVGEIHENAAEVEAARRELERLTLTEARDDDFALEEQDDAEPPTPGDLPALLDLAIAHRPELAGIQEAARRAALQGRLAKADYYPDFTIGLGYMGAGERTSDYYALDSDDRTDHVVASFGINIPLGNARRRAAAAQAVKDAEATRLREEAALDGIVESIAAKLAAIESLRLRRALYADSIIPLAEEALLATEAAYRSAQADYVETLGARRAVLAARRQAIRLLRDHRVAVADLERAVGAPLDQIPAALEVEP